jgi:GAF domain-containing protein
MLKMPRNPRTPIYDSDDSFLDNIRSRFLRIILITAIATSWVFLIINTFIGDEIASELILVMIIIHSVGFILWPWLSDDNYTPKTAIVMQIGFMIVLMYASSLPMLTLLGVTGLLVGAYTFQRIPFMIMNLFTVGLFVYRAVEDILAGGDTTVMIAVVGLVILPLIGFTSRFVSTSIQTVAERARRSNELLQTTAEVGQIANAILSQDDLFRRAVELIRDRFDYYHVQIFLVDEDRQYANLVASTGEVGQRLLVRRHRLAIGSQSVIGRVTQTGEAIIARDTDRDPLHARNELLPNTRSELALPITDGGRIIGALDVQSTKSNAFQLIDVRALEIMASQLGVAIRNARLFESQMISVQENKRLFFESEANLREIQRLNRQLTQRTWRDYIASFGTITGVTAYSDDTLIQDEVWTDTMIDASLRRRVVPSQDRTVLDVPIILRGEIVGVIEVETKPHGINDDTIELTQSIAGRLAVSLDNARLFEEAQQGIVHEQRLNEIVNKYQSANTVDDLLQITLSELQEIFGAETGHIRLGYVEANSANQNGHHGGENE